MRDSGLGDAMTSDTCIQTLQRAYRHLCAEDLVTAEGLLSALSAEITQAEADWQRAPHGGIPPELIMYPWYLGILLRKRGNAKEAVQCLQVALGHAKDREEASNVARLLLDYGTALCTLAWCEDQATNLERAQSTWALAADLGEQASDFSVAAKAAKCRAMLLSISDNPHLSAPELARAKRLFERARDFEGLNRAVAFEEASQEQKLAMALGLGRTSGTGEGPARHRPVDLNQWLERRRQATASSAPQPPKGEDVVILESPVKRKFDGPIQAAGRPPIENREHFKAQTAKCHRALFTGEFEEALRVADDLVDREPLRGIPWLLRAQALGGLTRFEEALTCCERALEIDPSDPDKWELKGSILETLGRSPASLEARQRAKALR